MHGNYTEKTGQCSNKRQVLRHLLVRNLRTQAVTVTMLSNGDARFGRFILHWMESSQETQTTKQPFDA